MTIVGALVHTEPQLRQSVQAQLETLQGVTVHLFDTPGQMALIVESENINQAHHFLTDSLTAIDGILAVYPVYTYLDK